MGSIGSKLQLKNTVTTQISSQSDNWKLRYSILDHIFGPSSGTLGPIPKKKFLWTIYLLWRGIGPNISHLGPILWEELRCKGILDHIFGPSSGTLGPIPKKFLRDNLPNMVGYWSNFQPSRSKNVGGVALERHKMAF